ncbi:hypothetical protein [Niallia sp.]|uniref:hypothetical protein n=1 Tax=Niallia sp. TaxID=2837523 RepID=UPI00289F6ACC|nr:hypothetical protein [Niallia sp.]
MAAQKTAFYRKNICRIPKVEDFLIEMMAKIEHKESRRIIETEYKRFIKNEKAIARE